MKCPKCGNENPEQIEFCAKCGEKLPDMQSMKGIEKTRRVTSRFTVIVAIVVIAIILGPLLVCVYFNADYSWSDSIRDSDGEGVADSTDVFPDDPAEWTDNDSDGVGDNEDLIDYGNAVVWISIDLYIGDGTADTGADEDGTLRDPYFIILTSIGEDYPISNPMSTFDEIEISGVFSNTENVRDPFSVMVDIPENQDQFVFRIYVYDDDGMSNEMIDCVGSSDFCEHYFGQPFTESFVSDGSLDSLDEIDCLLVYSIILGSEEYGEYGEPFL